MKLDDLPEFRREEYTKVCEVCTMEMKVLTQDDNFPEYKTQIYIQCSCGNYLEFILPVN